MNKQEYQQKIKNMKRPKFFNAITLDEAYEAGFEEAKNNALFESCFLDEPEKPVVPQNVADFYESIKDDFEDGVYELCIQLYNCDLDGRINFWFDRDDSKPIETLVKMRLYGYEVERYKVALKSNGFGVGVHQEDGSMKTIFTREELAKYGFNNLDEYTVTEVEE